MKLRTTLAASATLAAGALLAVAVPLSASAHIGVAPTSTAAGSGTVLTFALPHGCDGSATTAIAIDIPESIASVTPTVNPNWDVAKVAVNLDKPRDDGHGNSITTRIGQIVYTAKAPLADGLRDTFALSLTLPADAAGTTLAFPVLQTCEAGSTAWDQVAKDGEAEPEHPAPSVAVTAAVAGDDHGHAASGDDPSAAAADGAAESGSDDVLARVLGIGGLVVGAVGVSLAAANRRKSA
ncbi:YcnI family copper-binding membrane protein [Glaciibacter sp. 2TAF33]|uniref:YcnI family copper-binding membrane protein n=1 Tax=Glaciibacter sp. 2TAF33 TaxID=3233015 RepID=UPI003F8FD286